MQCGKRWLSSRPSSAGALAPALRRAGMTAEGFDVQRSIHASGLHCLAAKVYKDPMLLELRTLYFEDLSVGMTERLDKTISSSDVVGFAEVTGDRNPIHLSEHFAARTSFGTRIAHGLYTASLI